MAASELDGMFLENLDEFVHDEGKVVTYKSLSHALNVHVNQAKQMLYSFVEKSRKDKKPVHVTYLVNGRQKTEDGMVCKVCVAKEDNLEAVKLTLDTVSSVHVYSVQKADLKDSNPLYMSDYDINKNIQQCASLSGIKCSQAHARSTDEIDQLEEEKRLQVLSSSQGSSSKQPVTGKVQPKKESEQSKPTTSAVSAAQPKSGKAKGQATMAQMFTKKATKEQETSETKKSDSPGEKENKDSKNVPTRGKAKPKMGGMMAFINKKPTVKASEPSKQPSKPSAQKNGVPVKQEENTKKETSKKPTVNKMSTSKGKEDTRKSGAKSKKMKELSSDEDEDLAPKKKKRRRIQQPESSSSSEEEMSEDDIVIPPTPPPQAPPLSPSPPPSPEPSPPPSPQPDTKSSNKTTKTTNGTGGKRRKHKRVLKSKQFINEDGFMVTEKVWESESTDASDVEEVPVKSAEPVKPSTQTKEPPAEKKKASPAGKSTKQAGIMSFFKKKAA